MKLSPSSLLTLALGSAAAEYFVPNNSTQTCTADEPHSTTFDEKIRGVCLGGWMVLEPWITPSLFYQFLGKDENTAAGDMYSFCKVLGKEEGNKQLRRHWDTWVTESIIEELKDSGAVNSLRLPVGDWMYVPYGPYVGCTDGALDYVDNLLDWAHANGLSVLLDIHGMKGSQNGFDNSGQAQGFEWHPVLYSLPSAGPTFEHWTIRSAGWMGTFDPVAERYTDINRENIQHGLDVIQVMVDRYKDHPAVLGLQPVNEPWQYTPMDELKKFYWEGYLIVKRSAPYWKYIMHDAFIFDPGVWGGFMDGCPDRALDTHIYQAWDEVGSRETFYAKACWQIDNIAKMEKAFGPVIVGEWSLATDNCAMWLNGFNDNLPGFPRRPCKYIPCADPYMGFDQPGTPVDPGKPAQGPFGTGISTPEFGLCPVGRDWLKESKQNTGKDWIKAPPDAPIGEDVTDEVMTNLAHKKIHVFSGIGHGFYFWNFRTDLYEPEWSYMLALERGWIPKGDLTDSKITDACNGSHMCVAKRDQLEKNVIDSINYVISSEGTIIKGEKELRLDCTSADVMLLNSAMLKSMTKDKLFEVADCAFDLFWKKNEKSWGACDFDGVATQTYIDTTHSDDDVRPTDKKYGVIFDLHTIEFAGMIVAAIILGALIGFAVSMSCNKGFNKAGSSTDQGQPIKESAEGSTEYYGSIS